LQHLFESEQVHLLSTPSKLKASLCAIEAATKTDAGNNRGFEVHLNPAKRKRGTAIAQALSFH
jgi:hypothetical protein